MKKTVFLILIITLLLAVPTEAAYAAPAESAAACILMEASTGTALYEDCADETMRIASTTKIMTALVVLENCRLSEKVDITSEYANVEGSSMYLAPGESLTVRELLYGLLLASGNDAAVALACHTAGSCEEFASLMNEKAEKLGCKNTGFVNPHGLDEEGQYSTARDLAVITSAALENPVFADIVATKSMNVHGREYVNHNKLLWNYDGALGVKTGYTTEAGRSLVSAVERDGMRLICVTLSDPADWEDHAALYDWGFEEYRLISVSPLGTELEPIPIVSGSADKLQVSVGSRFSQLCKAEDKVDITTEIKKFVYAPVTSGETAGTIIITVNGETAAEIPIVFTEGTEVDEETPLNGWERIRLYLSRLFGGDG